MMSYYSCFFSAVIHLVLELDFFILCQCHWSPSGKDTLITIFQSWNKQKETWFMWGGIQFNYGHHFFVRSEPEGLVDLFELLDKALDIDNDSSDLEQLLKQFNNIVKSHTIYSEIHWVPTIHLIINWNIVFIPYSPSKKSYDRIVMLGICVHLSKSKLVPCSIEKYILATFVLSWYCTYLKHNFH